MTRERPVPTTRHHRPVALLLTLAALVAAMAGPAWANPVLRWSPSGAYILPGQQTTLSVMLDEPLDVRTVELRVTFDPAIIASIGGGPGALFDGLTTFADFVQESPDTWYGYCVVLGASDWATGTGPLFEWTIEGLVEGVSPVTSVTVTLLPPGGGDYPDVVLIDDTVTVDSTTGVTASPVAPRLGLYPNPFNPRTTVELSLPGGGTGQVDVFDARGRAVATLWSGDAPADSPLRLQWDGRDRRGNACASGVYTFVLTSTDGTPVHVQGVLAR